MFQSPFLTLVIAVKTNAGEMRKKRKKKLYLILSAYSHKLIVMTVRPLNMKYFQFDSKYKWKR